MITVCFHLGYQSLWEYFREHLDTVLEEDETNNVLITFQTLTPKVVRARRYIEERYGKRVLTFMTRRGMDVGGQLIMFNEILRRGLDPTLVLVLHTKRDPVWRSELVEPLVGNRETLLRNVAMFDNPSVGMVGSSRWFRAGDCINKKTMEKICGQLGVRYTPKYCFIAGTMFLVRWELFRRVFENKNLLEFYAQLEGEGYTCNDRPTMIHAWERVFGLLVTAQGSQIVGVEKLRAPDK